MVYVEKLWPKMRKCGRNEKSVAKSDSMKSEGRVKITEKGVSTV